MKLNQNDFEHLKDKLSLGEMTAAEANVQKVRMQRVLLVSRLPGDVRRALNAAVKRGDLGHMKKDGHKPEAYFHPTFDYLARQERYAHECSVIRAMSAVCG
ncbi:hypothetical protein [Delftia tsuruhatensis]|uniref:hypothetical protein n=1 Tax=Delftia tsuruhatensis TaxID=180282 RepID=UPI0020288607|nr:hypothetical protein [Delftia tsuruhatensis]